MYSILFRAESSYVNIKFTQQSDRLELQARHAGVAGLDGLGEEERVGVGGPGVPAYTGQVSSYSVMSTSEVGALLTS